MNENKGSVVRFIGKFILGSAGTILLIIWAILSYIQQEIKMDFYRWVFVIFICLSIGYGLYELVVFLYLLWRRSHKHEDKEKQFYVDKLNNLKKECFEYYELSRIEISNSLKIIQRDIFPLKLLLIDSAQYGAKGQINEVAHILRSKISIGRIDGFPVNNDTLGPDPIKGTHKTLTVKYTYLGESKSIEIQERGYLSLP